MHFKEPAEGARQHRVFKRLNEKYVQVAKIDKHDFEIEYSKKVKLSKEEKNEILAYRNSVLAERTAELDKQALDNLPSTLGMATRALKISVYPGSIWETSVRREIDRFLECLTLSAKLSKR